MEEGSFFGEYQVMLDLKSSNVYRATNKSHKICKRPNFPEGSEISAFILDKERFLTLLTQD